MLEHLKELTIQARGSCRSHRDAEKQENRTALYGAGENHRWVLDIATDRALAMNLPFVQFIGLNPSTATELANDPTVRRCLGFSRAWGFERMVMTNLFAFRATDPEEMKRKAFPEGTLASTAIVEVAKRAELVVACWGVHGEFQRRADMVLHYLQDHKAKLRCLGRTKEGHPRHPLYLAAKTQLEAFA